MAGRPPLAFTCTTSFFVSVVYGYMNAQLAAIIWHDRFFFHGVLWRCLVFCFCLCCCICFLTAICCAFVCCVLRLRTNIIGGLSHQAKQDAKRERHYALHSRKLWWGLDDHHLPRVQGRKHQGILYDIFAHDKIYYVVVRNTTQETLVLRKAHALLSLHS